MSLSNVSGNYQHDTVGGLTENLIPESDSQYGVAEMLNVETRMALNKKAPIDEHEQSGAIQLLQREF